MSKLNKIKDLIGSKIKLSGDEDFKFLYNSGVDAFAKKDFEKAIEYFTLSTQKEEKQPQAYYNLALSYQHMKEYEKAVASYSKFLEIVPNDYDGLYNLGLVYFSKGNFKKAIEIFEKCVNLSMDKESIKALILAYLENKESQNAINFAEDLLQTYPDKIDLYYEIAKTFETKNSLSKDFTFIDTAIEMYSKLMEKDENYFDAYLSTSICYAKKGEWGMSVEFCEKALEKNPKSYEANNQMGLVYYCCNEIKEAINYYETALELKPVGDYKVYSNLAYAYEKIGKYDNAINMFTQLIRKFPDCPSKDEIKNHLRVIKSL